MDTYSFNFYHIFNFILLLLALFGAFYITKDIINAFTGRQHLKLIEKLTDKDIRVITVENAQEIHEINKNYELLEKRIGMIEWNYKEIIKNAHNSN